MLFLLPKSHSFLSPWTNPSPGSFTINNNLQHKEKGRKKWPKIHNQKPAESNRTTYPENHFFSRQQQTNSSNRTAQHNRTESQSHNTTEQKANPTTVSSTQTGRQSHIETGFESSKNTKGIKSFFPFVDLGCRVLFSWLLGLKIDKGLEKGRNRKKKQRKKTKILGFRRGGTAATVGQPPLEHSLKASFLL